MGTACALPMVAWQRDTLSRMWLKSGLHDQPGSSSGTCAGGQWVRARECAKRKIQRSALRSVQHDAHSRILKDRNRCAPYAHPYNCSRCHDAATAMMHRQASTAAFTRS
eukprot:583600-Pelagomonas_calceolata.AAC.3